MIHHRGTWVLMTVLWGIQSLVFAQQEKASEYYNDSSCYDVKCYDLRISASPDSLYIKGSTSIVATVEKKTLTRFYIQLNDALTVDSVIINEHPSTFEHSGNWIKAITPQKIEVGKMLQATIHYHGNAVSSNVMGGLGIGTTGNSENGCKVFYTLSEPYAALDFFACKQWVTDKADSLKIYITTPKPYMAVANGLLRSVDEKPNNRRTFYWESHYPIAYYLIGFAVGEFKSYNYRFLSTKSGDSIRFENYHCFSDAEWPEYKNSIDKTVEIINYYESLIGVLYPFGREKYGHVVVPIGGGMENQTITFLQNFDFTLVAHELAHSWFGNYVTCSDWQNIWINEGFATYLSYLALEKFYPAEAPDWLNSCLELATRDSLASIYIPADKVFDPLRIFSYYNTYMKGAYFLHTLRYFTESDEIFFQVWQNFLQKYAYKNAGVEDFKRELEAKTGRSWSAFFNEWFYGKGYPVIHLSGIAKNNFLQLQGMVKASSSDNRYSPIPVPVRIQWQNGGDTLIRIVLSDTTSRHSFFFSSPVTAITVDPQHQLLAKFKISFAIDTTPLQSIRTFPNPFNDCFQVIFPTTDTSAVERKLWIYNMAGQQVYSLQTHQRLPQVCLAKLISGTYLLVAQKQDQWYVGRIMKR